MRPLAIASSVLFASVSASAAAPRDVVVILPPVAAQADEAVALAMQARAAALVQAVGGAEIHAKQILRMSEHEGIARASLGDAEPARRAAMLLGASRGLRGPHHVRGTLSRRAGWLVLEGEALVEGQAPKAFSAPLGVDAAAAVAKGGLALAKAAMPSAEAKLAALPNPPWPPALSDCLAVLERQPLGIEQPTLLEERELEGARAACKKATEVAPASDDAWAGYAFALALWGDDKAAIDALAKVKDGKDVPQYWLARFWLVTRYRSSAEGAEVLREAIAQRPGFLLARGYLGELLHAIRDDRGALEAWQGYAEVVPQSPFALAKVGYAQARLGRTTEAIATTRKALSFYPESRDLQLELGSRYIDAKRWDDAVATLGALAAQPGTKGETLVRLAWAELQRGKADAAEKLLRQALERATGPTEWRTRGRARFDLAAICLGAGRQDCVDQEIDRALREGYEPRPGIDPKLAAAVLRGKDRRKRLAKGADLSVSPGVVEKSPFLLDRGEIQPQKRPKPPENVELLRFGGVRGPRK